MQTILKQSNIYYWRTRVSFDGHLVCIRNEPSLIKNCFSLLLLLRVLARCSIYNLISEPNAAAAHNRIYAKLRNQNAKITKLSPNVDSNLDEDGENENGTAKNKSNNV